MAVKHNFITLKGENFLLTIAGLKDKAGNEIDLTGHTVTLTIKDKADNELAEYPVVIAETPVTINVPVAEVDSWPLGNNKYTLKHTQPDGTVRYFAYGSITLTEVD